MTARRRSQAWFWPALLAIVLVLLDLGTALAAEQQRGRRGEAERRRVETERTTRDTQATNAERNRRRTETAANEAQVAEGKTGQQADKATNTADQARGRKGAFNEAKRDANIPRSQQPDQNPSNRRSYERVAMTDRSGRAVLGPNGQPIMTREYSYTRADGTKVVIQDHSAGHKYREGGVGDQGAHVNVRPAENTRNGSVPGTKGHYEWSK